MSHEVFSTCFFRAYSLLWRLARPLLRCNKRLSKAWKERLIPDDWCEPVDLWLQAASGGEARLALTLLEHLPERPRLRVLLATWTAQGREMAEKALPEMLRRRPWLDVTVRYAPLDDPSVARQAVAQASPKLLVLLETEIWPGLLGACAEAGVPVYVVNGRMTKSSYRWYKLIRSSLRRLPVRRVLAISQADAERFADIFGCPAGRNTDEAGLCDVSVMPNMKFDRADESRDMPYLPDLAPRFRLADPVILFASVRRQEESLLAPLLKRLFRVFPRAAVVVVPRHLERANAWMDRLYDLGFGPERISAMQPDQPVQPGKTLVWDRFGDLPQLYAVADAAFVGGSLADLGGQNFLESLSTGLAPCVGPHLDNFRWALGLENPPSLVEAGLVTICATPREVARALAERALQPEDREHVRQRFHIWLQSRTGGASRAVQALEEGLRGA